MDPIRPIGPPERDLEPVVRVTRSSPDARRERPDPRDGAPPREQRPRQPAPPPQPPPDDESGPSLIDVRV
jgi:hypothetical protein